MTTPKLSAEQLYDLSVAEELSARYKILKPIGNGVGSMVYLAQDQFEQREVAIKVAHLADAENADGKQLDLWMNEVRLAGQLKHPFVVNTYEAGLIKAGGYVVMEYLPGGTLKPFIQQDKLLPIERVLEILFKVCKALEYVYSTGISHRNIKPGNILLSQNGDIKVSDFGSCHQSNSRENQMLNRETQALDVDTFDYVPPELFKNAAPNVQFDIYATGLMVYQLLTGCSPYTGHIPYTDNISKNLIYQKLSVAPPPLSKWRQDIPARLSEVVLRAIALDPAQRYSEWKALIDDLVAALSALQSHREVANDSAKYEALSKLEFFSEFNQMELWETVQISNWIRYKPGDAIVSEGDFGTSMYVIVIGEADVLKGSAKINHMKPGSCFGELAYLDKGSQQRTADVIATTMLVALCIDGQRLRKSSNGLQARFSGALLRAMLGKITQSDKRFIALAEQMKSKH
jgi:serine/threonine protein kinase